MLLPHIPPSPCISSLGWGLLRELPPPAAALGSEGRELSETLQVLLEEKKVKHSWDYNRREGWGEIMQMSSEVFNCSEGQCP